MRSLLLVLLTWLSLGAQDVSGLPLWAQAPARAGLAEQPPGDPDAWVLLKRMEITYTGEGEIKTRELRLVRVLRERGIQERLFLLQTLGGESERITALRGWNLRPDGEVVKISKSDMAKLDPDRHGETTQAMVNFAWIPRVAKGSLVAFEWETSTRVTLGPAVTVSPLEDLPIRRWELAAFLNSGQFFYKAKGQCRVATRMFGAWGIPLERTTSGEDLWADRLPALPKDEKSFPAGRGFLPGVDVTFVDPELRTAPLLDTWDSLATWIWRTYQEGMVPSGLVPRKGGNSADGLKALVHWMSRELTYKQVYLSAGRGWLPLSGPEVVRRRNGDCKDHAECFLAEAAGLGFKGFPVLCAIQDAEIPDDQAVTPYCFNHVIAAIQIGQSLGLASEVATPQGRFLLVDTTDRFCPLGVLPADHRDRRVLICTPDGAVWARVPPAATVRPKVAFDLEGTILEDGSVAADITVTEEGNRLGLRFATLNGGVDMLLQRLQVELSGLPVNARLECLKVGDPLDLETPFRIEVRIHCPDAARRVGSEVSLPAWGLPALPGVIQRPGKARVYPVQVRHRADWHYKSTWTLPQAATPLLRGLQTDNPLASTSWNATSSGRVLHLALVYEEKDAAFDFKAAQAGVQAWRANRSELERVLREGLTAR
jgi:hypothetical protein